MKQLFACLTLLLIVTHSGAYAQAPVAAPPSSLKQQRDAIARNLADDSDMASRYVYNDAQTVDKQVSLSLPVMPDQDIQDWLVNTVPQIFSADPKSYPVHMTKVKNFFVQSGWDQYQTQWAESRIEYLVTNQGYRISAMVIDTPRIIAKGRQRTATDPAYRWIAETPVLLSYVKGNTAPQTFQITLRIGLTRIPVMKDGTLVAIDEWRTIPKPAEAGAAR